MKSIEISAKTIEEAISQGLEKLSVSLGDVGIDIIEEGTRGLFGIFGKKDAKVKLTLKDDNEQSDILSTLKSNNTTKQNVKVVNKNNNENKASKAKVVKKINQKTAQEKNNENKSNANLSTSEDDKIYDEQTPIGKAQHFLIDVTKLMNVDVTVKANVDDEGNIHIDMFGDTLGILIGRRGETLDALQYLTSLTVNKGQESYTRVTLDTENYRAKREEALKRLANRMANRAVKTGRKVVMEPMNPYERRILHSALQQNNAVSTHSEGDEPNRHVVITVK